MLQAEDFRLRELLHSTLRAAFAATIALAVLAGATASARAQEKLTAAQQQTMAQCLTGCKKGDANCQNSCTKQVASPAYLNAAGSCVRACADALAVPGQQNQSHAGDLQKCVQACN